MEAHARGQSAGHRERRSRIAGRRDLEVARLPSRERDSTRARQRTRLIDREREVLEMVRAHSVVSGERQAVIPDVPAVGVPDKLAVPSPLSWRLTPEGRAPVTVSVGAGYPACRQRTIRLSR